MPCLQLLLGSRRGTRQLLPQFRRGGAPACPWLPLAPWGLQLQLCIPDAAGVMTVVTPQPTGAINSSEKEKFKTRHQKLSMEGK